MTGTVARATLLLMAAALTSAAASQRPSDARAAGAATAQPLRVGIGFNSYRPDRLDIVAGEAVRWTNGSVRAHTATADDGSFDSGYLGRSEGYTRRFGAAGERPYHCTLHPSMRGVVAVHDLLLEAPAQAAAPNRAYPLAGRSALPAGTAVSIEADSGVGFARVASAAVGRDGRFAVRLVPVATASYRAIAGVATSKPVRLAVASRRVALTVRRLARGRVRLHAKVTPPERGGRVVLQQYVTARRVWRRVRQARLGADSAAAFTIRPQRRLRVRAALTLADGTTTLAESRAVWIGRAA
ncbi:MAG TPA: hypothetical protein VGV90_06925 [Solirubrobacteraceae bacterium]|nr:hypothetical protein [Solirubrobacteraceae bacterium]